MTWRCEVAATELARSPAWDDARADATVVVATCNRSAWLAGLIKALEQQAISLEVVLVDDASDDDTAAVLASLPTALPLLVLRTPGRSGPSAARNAGAARARTPHLLLTDDDCLPSPSWASALLRELSAGATVVQGRTLPAEDPHGPWDRAITVEGPTGLYETCNLGLSAAGFLALGGFADLGLLAGSGSRGFGEDAELGSALAARGRAGWAADALVRHRWVPSSYADHLAGRRRLQAFPALASLVPDVQERLVAGVLLSRRTLVTDVGISALLVAAAGRRVSPLVAVVPWALRLAAEAGGRPGRPRAVRVGQLALADVIGAAALLRGSLRVRKPVL